MFKNELEFKWTIQSYEISKTIKEFYQPMENYMTTETKQERIILPTRISYNNTKDYQRKPYEYNFKAKEDYINFRKIWKETYIELSQEIKDQKKIRSTHGHQQKSNAVSRVHVLKENARSFMYILEEGKKLAKQMKENEKLKIPVLN